MLDAAVQMFWLVGTKLVSELLVPVIGIALVFSIFYSALGMTRR